MRQDVLIIGEQYECYRNGKVIGIATYVHDENIGDSFIREVVDPKGRIINEVFWPHEWKLMINLR